MKFKYLLPILVLFLVKSSFSQISHEDSLKYSFIKFEKNKIYNDTAGLSQFFSQLKAIEDGAQRTLTIYQIGDSHVAGKLYPEHMATHIHLNFGDNGTEIVTENVSGRHRKGHHSKISKSHHKKKAVSKKSSKKTSKKRRHASLDNYDDSQFLALISDQGMNQLKPSYETEFSSEIVPDLYQGSPKGIKYMAYGVNGKTYKYFYDSPKMAEHLMTEKPALIIISLGGNDAFGGDFHEEYVRTNLDLLVNKIKSYLPGASILLQTPTDAFVNRSHPNENIKTIHDIVIDYAAKNKIACWDAFEVMGGLGSMNICYDNLLAGGDKIHFTSEGYRIVSGLLFTALMISYEHYINFKLK